MKKFLLLLGLLSATAFAGPGDSYQSFKGERVFETGFGLTRTDESTGATLAGMTSVTNYVKLSSTVTTINGAAPPTTPDSKFLIINNNTGGTVTINHESGSATGATYRFSLPASAAIALANKMSAIFIYDFGQSRWVLAAGGGFAVATSLSGVTPVANGGTNSSASLNNNRVMKSSGGAVVEAAAITGNKALASDSNGIPVATSVTDTELGYVSGVTSALQTQIDGKQATDADLTALAALSGTNTIYYRSASNTWSAVTFSGITFVGGVLTAAGASLSVKIIGFSFGQGSDPSDCSSSPCTVYRQSSTTGSNGVGSVTRGGNGAYTINWTSSFFSTAPQCGLTGFGSGAPRLPYSTSLPTTTSWAIGTRDPNSLIDSGVMFICIGT